MREIAGVAAGELSAEEKRGLITFLRTPGGPS
jgi:hypothetical protein